MSEDKLVQFAIAMHTQAIKALMDYIDGAIETLPEATRDAEQCGLGRWFESEGARYAAMPAYTRAREIHRKFHAALVDVAAAASSGSRQDAFTQLRLQNAFPALSQDILAAFDELARAIARQDATDKG